MSTITTRAGKGSPLTNTEVDANFTNLNDDKLESSQYTASDVLDKIKTVDGTGSGLDADLLDGNEASAFATSSQGSLADSALQPSDNISELTNDAGYLTSYTETDPVVGAITGIVKADGGGNISAAVAGTDYLASETYTGTVTSVSGTGTVNGLTLTGTVTTSGDLTLGGTLAVQASDIDSETATDGYVLTADGAGNAAWEAAPAGYTDSDVDAHLNTATASSGEVLSWTGTDYDWVAAGGAGGASALTIDNKTAAYTVVAGDLGKIINCTSGTFTVSLTAAATLGAGFNCWIRNSSGGFSDFITVDPSGSETIDSLATITLRNNEQIHIVSTGTNFIIIRSKLSAFSDNLAGGGALPIASGKRAVAIGNAAVASAQWSNAWGLSTGATSDHSTAIGQNSSAGGSQTSLGAGAMALGGSRASGTDSFAAAIANNTSSYGATGANSVAIGSLAKASAADSIALGDRSVTSVVGYAIGREHQVTGSYCAAIGYGNFSGGSSSIALGNRSKTSLFGQLSQASGMFASEGDAQRSAFVLRADTTDSTPEALTANNNTPSTLNQIILPNNSAYAFHGTIVARQQASAGTACAAWKIEGLIRREGSAGTTVLVNSATTVLDNTPDWGMALSADTTNGGLKIEVTGEAATNIRWVATVHTSEVTY